MTGASGWKTSKEVAKLAKKVKKTYNSSKKFNLTIITFYTIILD